MKTWNLGNTSVRNPLRFEEGLRAIQKHVIGKTFESKGWQVAVYEAMKAEGVVETDAPKEPALFGRKWVSGPEQLGFLRKSEDQTRLFLTPCGAALIDGTIPPEDVFLRQLLKYALPNELESGTTYEGFSIHPFHLVASLLLKLQFEGLQSAGLSQDELALFVVTCIRNEDIAETEFLIRTFRQACDQSGSSKREIIERMYEELCTKRGITIQKDSLYAYADTTRRYLLRSNVFTIEHHRLCIDETKKSVAEFISNHGLRIAQGITPMQFEDPLYPELPFTKREYLLSALHNLKTLADKRSVTVTLPLDWSEKDAVELRTIQLGAERQFTEQSEITWAATLSEKIPEIMAAFDAIADGTFLGSGSAPSLYEWNTWRAFLALGNHTNHVSETRGFSIEASMLPKSHAAGGQPDLRFEYPEFTLVLEVSLLQGESQWCREHEPVSRHVKEISKDGTKPAIGLFVGPSVHANTYQNFFQSRQLYVKDGDTLKLVDVAVLPLTHAQLCRIIVNPAMKSSGALYALLSTLSRRDGYADGLAWKDGIEKILTSS